MPRCGGRGICGCGRSSCADAIWWFHWGGLWQLIAFEMSERSEQHNARRDDEIWIARVERMAACR